VTKKLPAVMPLNPPPNKTRRYANLLTEDLQAVHQKISLLAA
jgi:hypothetical protein